MAPDTRVGVIGLGYVGLPLAIAFVEAGLQVEGIDASPARVAELNARHSPIDDISDERLAAALEGGLRVVGPDDARPREVDALFVCVPTPITPTKDPDLGPVLAAAAFVRDGLRAGQLVVLQSTTFPGTTTGPFREVVEALRADRGRRLRPGLRPRAGQPRRPGQLRPGRAAPGRRHDPGRRPPARRRSSGGSTTGSSRCPRPTRPRWPSSSRTRSATSTSRSSTSSPCCASGWASTCGRSSTPRRPSRSGSCASRPGPGVGGHCIPVDPYYLAWRAREFDFTDRFIELAGDINFGDAAPRRRPRGRGAQRPLPGAQGRAGRGHRRRLQAGRPGRPQLAGRRRSCPCSSSVAATSATTTRSSASSGTTPGRSTRARTSTSCSPGPTRSSS